MDDGHDTKHGNPNNLGDVYASNSLNVVARLRQDLEMPAQQHLKDVRQIIDESFNGFVCLDLESCFIKVLDGDGASRVLNRNYGC